MDRIYEEVNSIRNALCFNDYYMISPTKTVGALKKVKMASLVVIAILLATMFTEIAFAKVWNETLTEAGKLPGAFLNGQDDVTKFNNSQAVAFDTFTGKDMYAFTLNNKKNKVKVSHMKYENGEFAVDKEVVYSKAQLDHANDATVYKQGKETYVIVAKGGLGNATAAMIKVSDFNKGKAKVYKVKFQNLDTRSGKDLRGITYVGKKKVKIKKKKINKQIFIVEAARRLNYMYIKSLKKNTITFEKLDSQRIKAPTVGNREGTANGIVYHRGFIYCAYADEGKGGKNQTLMIDRMNMNTLFKTKNASKAVKFTFNFKKEFGEAFTTESVFFTSLEKKENFFVSGNGGEGAFPKDFIYRSQGKY